MSLRHKIIEWLGGMTTQEVDVILESYKRANESYATIDEKKTELIDAQRDHIAQLEEYISMLKRAYYNATGQRVDCWSENDESK